MENCKWKYILKWVGIAIAIAGAAAAAYFLISKFIAKKRAEDEEEDYISCICFEEDEADETEADSAE